MAVKANMSREFSASVAGSDEGSGGDLTTGFVGAEGC